MVRSVESGGATQARSRHESAAHASPRIVCCSSRFLGSLLMFFRVVCCVRFSKDGRFLATGCNRTAQVYDARTGAKVWYAVTSCLRVSAIHHCHSSLIDPSVPKGGDLYIRSVCFSPDGMLLATGAEDTQIRVSHLHPLSARRSQSPDMGHRPETHHRRPLRAPAGDLRPRLLR
jgi:WD40 repeat protein